MTHKEFKEVEQTPIHLKRVLNLQEASAWTGYTERHMRKLVAIGQVPCSKPNGGFLRFDRFALDEWMLGNPKTRREKVETEAATYVTSIPV
jgi:prophage regulatory protein